MDKGQLSTEYLVILAVVVIVALIVVTVLGGFIDIGAGAGVQASKSYWRGADIGLLNWKVALAGSSSYFTVRNNLDYTIQITSFTVDGVTVIGGGGGMVSLTLNPGQSRTVNQDISTCAAGSAGSPYAAAVSVIYTDVDHTIADLKFDGVKKIEGTC